MATRTVYQIKETPLVANIATASLPAVAYDERRIAIGFVQANGAGVCSVSTNPSALVGSTACVGGQADTTGQLWLDQERQPQLVKQAWYYYGQSMGIGGACLIVFEVLEYDVAVDVDPDGNPVPTATPTPLTVPGEDGRNGQVASLIQRLRQIGSKLRGGRC